MPKYFSISLPYNSLFYSNKMLIVLDVPVRNIKLTFSVMFLFIVQNYLNDGFPCFVIGLVNECTTDLHN